MRLVAAEVLPALSLTLSPSDCFGYLFGWHQDLQLIVVYVHDDINLAYV